MDERSRCVLILDTDPDVLVTLQHALRASEIEAAVAWDEIGAFQLIGSVTFDLMLIGDQPPEFDAAAILEGLSFRGNCPPALILRDVVRERDIRYFRWLGAVGVVSKRDTSAVVDEVIKALAPMHFNASAA